MSQGCPHLALTLSCLKNVQKQEMIHHVPYRKHFYCSKWPTQLIKSVLRKKGSSYTA